MAGRGKVGNVGTQKSKSGHLSPSDSVGHARRVINSVVNGKEIKWNKFVDEY